MEFLHGHAAIGHHPLQNAQSALELSVFRHGAKNRVSKVRASLSWKIQYRSQEIKV
jgi:hypothetical protein